MQKPLERVAVRLMERTAMVVFELLEGVPVAVTQSPTVMELTASVTVLENWVVPVQLTVVCPVLGFCTSMLEAARAAMLPLAPIGPFAVEAAPADDAAAVVATITAAPVPRHRAQRRRLRRLVGVCISLFLISLLGVSLPVSSVMSR
jgi:hypothetical protein